MDRTETSALKRLEPNPVGNSGPESMPSQQNAVDSTIVLAGPGRWRITVEELIGSDRNLAIVNRVDADLRGVDIHDISKQDVVLIAVDGNDPRRAIIFATQVRAQNADAGIVLVLPNMSKEHLWSFHTHGDGWSLISAISCGDQPTLNTAIESVARGIAWIDPLITQLVQTLEHQAGEAEQGPDEFTTSQDVQANKTHPGNTKPAEETLNFRILVVDDNDDVRMALQILLEGLDYEVMEAGDGEEAFGLARAFVPDVILLDVMMPKVDGFNALKSLKTDTITKNIPVIMVTARGGRNDEEIARGLGAFDYLHKPWSDGEVEMVVNWALTRQRRAA